MPATGRDHIPGAVLDPPLWRVLDGRRASDSIDWQRPSLVHKMDTLYETLRCDLIGRGSLHLPY